jgi:hypothetical protein
LPFLPEILKIKQQDLSDLDPPMQPPAENREPWLNPMNRKWRLILILLLTAWWVPALVADAKINQFKDDQGTVHITNLKPEEEAKPAPPAGPGPIQLHIPGAKSPEASAPPPPPQGPIMEPPDEQEAPEPPEPPEPPEAQ